MRKFYNLIFILFIIIGTNLTAFPQIPNYVPLGSLRAWYPFDGNANDAGGNNLNGIIHGNVISTTNRNNNPNSAYYFSGAGNGADWIEVLHNPLLNLGPSFTVSAWIYNDNSNYGCIVMKGRDVSNGSYDLYWGGININGAGGAGAGNISLIDTAIWYMITGVLDGNTGKLKVYKNGVFAIEVNTSPFVANNTFSLAIGRHLTYMPPSNSDSYPYPFKGKIDDVGLWNRALSSCEIYQLYTGILANNPTVNLGNDTTLTQGSTLTLNAGNTGSTYLWSTNDTTQTINVSTAGTYWVKVTNSGGCYSADTIYIDFTTSTTINQMNDTTICKGESVTLTANAAAANTWQYFQDFENTVGNEWSDTNRLTFNGSKNLGYYGNQTVNLNLSSLPAHDSVEISFDLYIHDTWDGNNSNGGPDFWSLFINNDTIINTTFANYPNYTQAFPQNFPSNNPLQTGAFLTNLPTRCFYNCGTSLYKISRTIFNVSNNLLINFYGNPIENICNESWSIDNVKVKLLNVNATPQYLWSTGATSASITVSPNQTTNYTVTVTNGASVLKDTTTVYVLNPQISYGLPTNNLQKKIFYLKGITSPYNIYSANINGTGETLIATGAIDASFGNNKIAFHNGSDVYIVNSDGTNLTIVPNTNDNLYQLDISKDGTKVCYAANDKLFTINTDGSNKTLFNNGSLTNEHQTRPSWKEAGKIYFVISNYGNAYTQKIYSKPDNNASATPTQLTTVFGQNPISGGIGNKVTYNGTTGALYIMNSDGTNVSQLTNAGNIAWGGVWDADTIYYTSNGNIGRIRSNNTDNSIIINDGNIIKVIGVNIPDFVANTHDTTICKGESVILTAHGGSQQNICNKSQLPTNLQQGLVAFYPFCGNANDESGSGHNGVVNGAILTTDRFGNANSAYLFNGVNNKITADTLPILNQYFSYSCWIKINGLTPGIIQSFGGIGGPQSQSLNHMWNFSYNPNLSRWDLYDHTNGSWYTNWTGQTSSSTLNWTNVTIVYNNVTEYLYVNGILLNQRTIVTPIQTFADRTLRLSEIGTQFLNGKIDNILIYNRALNTNEIQEIYALGIATSASYLWSTGDTTQSITVTPNQTTTYTLSVTNGNISCMDTLAVNVLNPQINNGQDTTICKGESICLNVTTANVINHVDSIANFTYIGKLNNHLYYRSNYQTDWQSAKIACQAKGGHLATISSIQENNLLFNYCNGYSQQTWFGFTDEVIEGDWKWITGEPVCYTNWAPGEPNNSYGGEDYSTLWCSINGWNDGDYIAPFFFLLEIEKNHYLWSTGDTVQNISVSPTQTNTYSVLVTNGNTSCSDTITVFVSNPQINLGNDTTICQGQSKTLTAGSGYSSYLWSTGATASQITVQNTGAYWIKAISNQGCTVRDSINLTFLPVQSNILRDTILCMGQSVIFNPGAGFTNHLWSTGATTNSLNVYLPGTFWIQAKQTNGCMIRDTVVVKYDSLSVSIASFANPSCFGGNNGSINTTINSLYPPFAFSWNTTPVLTTQNLSNLLAGNYILTFTDSLGCIKTASQTLTAPTPVVISLGNDTSFCQGQSIVLQATQVFTSYLWSTGASTQSVNVNTQGAYWLKGTNASGCSGYDTINITLNPTPIVQIAPTNPSVCKGESITLTASSNLLSTTYTWSNTATTTTVNLSPTLTTSYFVIGKLNQCVDTAFATINVKPLPIISTTADKNPICEGESTNLTAGSNMPSTTYVWNNNVTGNTLSVAPNNSAYYYVTGTASNCHDTSGITINVITQQSINLGVDDYLCVGDEKTLNANNLLGVFLWSNGTSGNTMIVNEPGVFWLRVDNNGCIASDTIVLKPCSEIWVSNVFTPNNDGINDIFKANTKEIQKFQLYIYNRWGNLVFETHDVNMGWDGKYAGGDAQSGVYYWVIRYNENRSSNQNVEKEIHGSVTLLR
ncbi:MAG: gliding motility-associated C-terminal domain-containing protein [Bacteroidetes bacterium]|nr:gliding motility-associated C-terminal domain-containing protein [Bacteroidota bacterium]